MDKDKLVHEYLSAIAKARWSKPETRNKASASHRERWADPAKRARYVEAQRKRRAREAQDKQP